MTINGAVNVAGGWSATRVLVFSGAPCQPHTGVNNRYRGGYNDPQGQISVIAIPRLIGVLKQIVERVPYVIGENTAQMVASARDAMTEAFWGALDESVILSEVGALLALAHTLSSTRAY